MRIPTPESGQTKRSGRKSNAPATGLKFCSELGRTATGQKNASAILLGRLFSRSDKRSKVPTSNGGWRSRVRTHQGCSRVLREETSMTIEVGDRKSTRLNSSHLVISYAV